MKKTYTELEEKIRKQKREQEIEQKKGDMEIGKRIADDLAAKNGLDYNDFQLAKQNKVSELTCDYIQDVLDDLDEATLPSNVINGFIARLNEIIEEIGAN